MFIENATYFFTVNLLQRKRKLLTEHITHLRHAFNQTKLKHPFTIDAIVILPDHLHAIFTLPKNDANFSIRWSLIKSNFSRQIIKNETISKSRLQKMSVEFGKEGFGSISFKMKKILIAMLIIFILILLNMVLSQIQLIANFQVFINLLKIKY